MVERVPTWESANSKISEMVVMDRCYRCCLSVAEVLLKCCCCCEGGKIDGSWCRDGKMPSIPQNMDRVLQIVLVLLAVDDTVVAVVTR